MFGTPTFAIARDVRSLLVITAVCTLIAGCNPYTLTGAPARPTAARSTSGNLAAQAADSIGTVGTAVPTAPPTSDLSAVPLAAAPPDPGPGSSALGGAPPTGPVPVATVPSPSAEPAPTAVPASSPVAGPASSPVAPLTSPVEPAPSPSPVPTAVPAPVPTPAPGSTTHPTATRAPGVPVATAAPGPSDATGAGSGSAATTFGWGSPNRSDDFTTGIGPGWSLYDGPGHNGQGRRSPGAATVSDGVLTINGSSDGTTEGMAWGPGQKYGRWEVRVRAPRSDPTYHAVALLWPDAENWPVGGEVDFMEMMSPSRQNTNFFLHYGRNNNQVSGDVAVDATQWHDWAVEWTPDHIAAFVDGREWFRTTDTSILPPGPMHLTLQLDWFPDGSPVTSSSMQVDWARQYSYP